MKKVLISFTVHVWDSVLHRPLAWIHHGSVNSATFKKVIHVKSAFSNIKFMLNQHEKCI